MLFSILRTAAKLRSSKMPIVSNKIVELADTPARKEDYIKTNGLRLVKPYYFDFLCSVKKRWLGMTIIDVFSQEFASRPRSYYEEAFEDGRLRIEGGKDTATADTPLSDNHRMRHFVHRHEPPVLDLPVEVVAETEDLIAVHKPPSVPVHVSGQYRKNTVMALLQVERPDLGRLFPVHRLDKPVSGLLLIAKNAVAANVVRALITDPGAVHKTYIARVLGSFPHDLITVDKQLAWDSRSNHAFLMEADGSMSNKQSLGKVPEASQSQKLQAKEAQTSFRLLSIAPDEQTSLVECRPKTGRTHQIRVHLSYLGYPIANDSQYGGTFRGPDQVRTHVAAARQGQLSHHELSNSADDAAVQTSHAPVSDRPHQESNKRQKYNSGAASSRSASGGVSPDTGCHGACDQPEPDEAVNSKTEPPEIGVEGDGTCLGEAAAGKATDLLVPADLQDDLCMNCPKLIPLGYPIVIHPLWLHAQQYTSEAWSFDCTKPRWANADWTPPPL